MEEDKYDHVKLFGHVRQSKYDLISTIPVSKLLLENKDIFAIGVLFESMGDFRFHQYKEECSSCLEASDKYDKRRVAYHFCSYVDGLEKQGHSGDCIRPPRTCTTCMAESLYSCALETFDEFIKLNIACTDPCIKLLAILFSTEKLYVECDNLLALWSRVRHREVPGLDINLAEVNEQHKELWNGLWDISFCYEHWKTLSLEEKEFCHKRAVRFRQYFDDRPTVKGIPWW